MDFFARRRACLFIEEKQTLELTKQLFANKINFLQQQFKSSLDSVNKNEFVVDEFGRGFSFLIDLSLKILSTLYHLTTNSEVEWAFLNTFVTKDTAFYSLGNLPEKVKCLKTDVITRDSDLFFFELFKFGIIDEKTWIHLSRLSRCKKQIGAENLNDFSYYEHKDRNIIDTPDAFKNFETQLEDIRNEFNDFVGKPLEFREFSPIFWKFLKSANAAKNYKQISVVFTSSDHKYEKLRINKSFQKLPQDQLKSLLDGLDKLDEFSKIHLVICEIKLFEDTELRNLFKHFFYFFLSQGKFIFDKENPKYLKRDYYSKILDATKWLDLIKFLCEIELDMFSDSNDTIVNNFAAACEIELEVLIDRRVIHHMFVLNFSNIVMIADSVKELKSNPFYVKKLAPFVDRYLGVIAQF